MDQAIIELTQVLCPWLKTWATTPSTNYWCAVILHFATKISLRTLPLLVCSSGVWVEGRTGKWGKDKSQYRGYECLWTSLGQMWQSVSGAWGWVSAILTVLVDVILMSCLKFAGFMSPFPSLPPLPLRQDLAVCPWSIWRTGWPWTSLNLLLPPECLHHLLYHTALLWSAFKTAFLSP